MKAFIFTDAGDHAGYGHLTRCMVLHEALKSRKIETQIYINADKDILLQAKIQYFSWGSIDFESIVSKNDICIVDSYQVTPIIEQRLSKITNKLLFIDDLGRYDRPGFVLNYSLNPKPPIKDYPKLLLGPKYALIREPFASYHSKFVIKEKIESVLITLGGSNYSNLAYDILDDLCSLNSEMHFHAIVSKKSVKSSYNNVKLLDYMSPNDLLNEMLQADVIVTSPSQTFYEALKIKVPIILVQTANNQKNNILDGFFTANYIKDGLDDENHMNYYLNLLKDYSQRAQMLLKYPALKNNAPVIIEKILKET